MIDINLLPVKNVLTQKEKNLRANLTRAFILISGGLLIISLIILGAKFFVRLQLDNQTTKRDQLLVDLRTAMARLENEKIQLLERVKELEINRIESDKQALNLETQALNLEAQIVEQQTQIRKQ